MHALQSTSVRFALPAALAAALLACAAASAEIIGLEGSAAATVTEFRDGVPGDQTDVIDFFPRTQQQFPVRVFAELSASDAPAAAAAAAQFADPQELLQPNPEEFAINLALNSASPFIYYTGQARTEETRTIVLSSSELGGAAEGETVTVAGKLFIDGAIALYGRQAGHDLTGASVSVQVTIVRQVGEQVVVLLSGRAELIGQSGGAVEVVTSGGLPGDTLILTQLGNASDEFATFPTLILPQLEVNYAYDVVAGEEFKLTATVQVEAQNAVDGVGVAALVGTPVDSIEQVIGLTVSDDAAAKTIATLRAARLDPARFVAPAANLSDGVLGGACGLFGVEFLIGLAGLVGWSGARRIRRHPRG
jgi:hypothetical protein